jgi:hypothetical protein
MLDGWPPFAYAPRSTIACPLSTRIPTQHERKKYNAAPEKADFEPTKDGFSRGVLRRKETDLVADVSVFWLQPTHDKRAMVPVRFMCTDAGYKKHKAELDAFVKSFAFRHRQGDLGGDTEAEAPLRGSWQRRLDCCARFYLCHALADQLVGFKQVDERFWQLFFGPVEIGIFDAAMRRLTTPTGEPS